MPPLLSPKLTGNARIDRAANGGTAFFAGSTENEVAAVQLLQLALVDLGIPLPLTFKGTTMPDGKYGTETTEGVRSFQKKAFPTEPKEWDGSVGGKTLAKMDARLRGTNPAPTPLPVLPAADFVCGPDVTADVIAAWTRIQTEFRARPRAQKIQLCNNILLPIKDPGGLILEILKSMKPGQFPDLTALKVKVQGHADTNGWDLLPLFQGNSSWLRTPPVFDVKLNGPFATPSSSDFSNADPFADGHEDEETCSNTVQVSGKCWLNGSVNYGTYGIMVKACSEFAASDLILPSLSKNPFDQSLKLNPIVRAIYSLTWATTLIRAYKKFGGHPEGAKVPIAWTEATFNGGPTGTPAIAENRPKCKCKPGLTGKLVKWDYVWDPLKTRILATSP